MSYWAASTQASSGLSPFLVIIVILVILLILVPIFRRKGSARSLCNQRKGPLGRCRKEILHPGDHDNGSTTWPRTGQDLSIYQGAVAKLELEEEERLQRQELVNRYEARQRRPPSSTLPADPPASPRFEPSSPVNSAPAQQPTSFSPAASQGTPSASGSKSSEMISAWLDELARLQPQYGRLLQSTVDGAGLLPAISDNGTIYTISHKTFWAAVGFSSALAGHMAERRRTGAVLAMVEARNAQDEATMVRKDDEAKFWTDVHSWIESVGVARTRPPILPQWLERFQPTFMPGG